MSKKRKKPLLKAVGVYEHPRFGGLRAIATEDGKEWFCLKDVVKRLKLGYNTLSVYKTLKKRGIRKANTPMAEILGRCKLGVEWVELLYIDEANLYRCIFQSQTPEAVAVQDILFEELLPTLAELSKKEEGKKSKRTQTAPQRVRKTA